MKTCTAKVCSGTTYTSSLFHRAVQESLIVLFSENTGYFCSLSRITDENASGHLRAGSKFYTRFGIPRNLEWKILLTLKQH